MNTIAIADATLRTCAAAADCELGFKEKIEIVRLLDRLCVDVIETPLLRNGKSDVLFLHTIAPLVRGTISCPAPLDEEQLRAAYEAVRSAKNPRLLLLAPVSAVQMEYFAHRKPPLVIEAIRKLTALAKSFNAEVEVALLDATRAEKDFLSSAAAAAIEGGADIVTLCDSAGTFFPSELAYFISDLVSAVPQLKNVRLGVECSGAMHMAAACAVACMKLGVAQLRTAVGVPSLLDVSELADVLGIKGRALNVGTHLNVTAQRKIAEQTRAIIAGKMTVAATAESSDGRQAAAPHLSASDDMASVAAAVSKLGYELSADDLGKVYEEFRRIALKKEIGPADLDAIVATVALQAPPVYKLKSFVINSGNIITSMAHVILEKNGEEVQGFSMGDGPIDAAFISIENIVGRHFELDDFQITAVTEGREAVGSSIVRLRSNGKLYSGKGVSTDIIGAGIRAYVNALNKICYEEEEKE